MPGIDGMAFLDELASGPHPPVLVVSSHTKEGSEQAEEVIKRGAVACFDKAKLVSEAKAFRKVLKKVSDTVWKPVKLSTAA
jgi:two-component system chemotaxis response regulator CheB